MESLPVADDFQRPCMVAMICLLVYFTVRALGAK